MGIVKGENLGEKKAEAPADIATYRARKRGAA
jgi:hypothetical protein